MEKGRRKARTEKDKERGIRDYRDFDTKRVREDISLPIAASHPAPAHPHSYGGGESAGKPVQRTGYALSTQTIEIR